jgi:hypothetical protein
MSEQAMGVQMLGWFLQFSDSPTWDELNISEGMDDDLLKQAFRIDAKAGSCRARPVKWMMLIDEYSEQRHAVAVYGDPPPRGLPAGPGHVIDGRAEWFPAVG